VDLAPVVQRLVDASPTTGTGAAPAQGQVDNAARTAVVAEPRSNSLIVRAANPARLNLVRSVVARLDVPGPAGSGAAGNIHVVYLRNADATKLAQILRAAIASTAPTTGPGGVSAVAASTPVTAPPNVTSGLSGAGSGTGTSAATAPITPSAQPSTGGQVQADPATNSLIITAPEPQYRQLRSVIDQLDGRRAQVLVEGIIVQVNADKVAQFGIQWQNVLGTASSSVIGFLGSNFTVGSAPNIIPLATQPGLSSGSITAPANGFNIGAVRNVSGRFILSAIANFLESSNDGNVLATPNLLTLDNEEAKIVVGENVPFVTGQFTNTGASNGSVNPFTTVDRKDVGLTLRVKPQINENGTVRLTIYQENSAVKAGTENALNGPTTTKQTVETNVVVDDGQIVVIGGLLQDQYSGNVQKVPGIGDVPGLGALFRSDNRQRTKSNLMVFLRPVVVRDEQDSDALSLDRYELMRTKQQNLQPESRTFLHNVETAPIVPQLAKPVPPGTTWSPLVQPPATTAPSVR
jgi:general secretion pathway protein D